MAYWDLPNQPPYSSSERDDLLKEWGAPKNLNLLEHSGGERFVVALRDGLIPAWKPNAGPMTAAEAISHMDTVGGFDF
ncbi:MAG: hypothetical protein ACPGVG_19880 [Mycobacterium sp.]